MWIEALINGMLKGPIGGVNFYFETVKSLEL